MNPRCVKCTGPHPTKECPLGQEKIPSPKCCNCEGDHPANYRGCPKFPENKRPIIKTSQFDPRRSYASATAPPTQPPNYSNLQFQNRNQNQTQTPQINNNINQSVDNPLSSFADLKAVLSEIHKELGVSSTKELFNKLQNMLFKMKQTNDPNHKLIIFLDGIEHIDSTAAP